MSVALNQAGRNEVGPLPTAAPRMLAAVDTGIVFDNVSKFYGEVLGINKVSLVLPPGITSLVGPNGAGKSTLMNLLAGLLYPTRGRVSVLGIPTTEGHELARVVGYCTQFDTFPRGVTGRQLVEGFLRLHGHDAVTTRRLASEAIERVGMSDAAGRKVAAYSKGMRQRIKLAQAIAHSPKVLILDEPLNGLDPMARAEVMALFADFAKGGSHVLISSHILHEVDKVSDRVVLLNEGYVVAEGAIGGVRSEMDSHPMQVLVRCDRPQLLAARLFAEDHVVEIKMHDDRRGLLARTKNADRFFAQLQEAVLADDLKVDAVYPADEDVQAVYEYLIGNSGEGL
jgi:ABC-2 type transport system ATP-binding protein